MMIPVPCEQVDTMQGHVVCCINHTIRLLVPSWCISSVTIIKSKFVIFDNAKIVFTIVHSPNRDIYALIDSPIKYIFCSQVKNIQGGKAYFFAKLNVAIAISVQVIIDIYIYHLLHFLCIWSHTIP